MKTPKPELLSVREVAQRLGLGTRTVWRWSATGQLPTPVRLGRSRRIVRWKAEEIDRYLEQLTQL
jgi:excisionase family DNA binding protein